MTAASSAMLLNASADRAGMVASIQEVSYELGGVLGIAILGSLLSGIYSASLTMPAGASVPDMARDSIDGALIVAEALPDGLASTLVYLAQRAFDNAFVAVMTVAVAMLIAASVGIAALARQAQRNQ
jgi:DHA2 family multidrug resistance protein-like MFS transporter